MAEELAGHRARTPWDELIATSSPDLHTVTTADGVLRFVSPASAALLGHEPADMVGHRESEFVHPHDVELMQTRHLALEREHGGSAGVTARLVRADGAWCWTEALSQFASVGANRVVVTAYRDIGERKEAEAKRDRLATTDPLTGVASRAVFLDRLELALRRLGRRDGLVAVVLLDIDQLHRINETAGNVAGDSVLRRAAAGLHGIVRPQDTLARVGDDEFAVVVEDMTSSWEAVALGARIKQAGCVPYEANGVTHLCSTSVGIVVTSDSRRGGEDFLREAELALLRAKGRGAASDVPAARTAEESTYA